MSKNRPYCARACKTQRPKFEKKVEAAANCLGWVTMTRKTKTRRKFKLSTTWEITKAGPLTGKDNHQQGDTDGSRHRGFSVHNQWGDVWKTVETSRSTRTQENRITLRTYRWRWTVLGEVKVIAKCEGHTVWHSKGTSLGSRRKRSKSSGKGLVEKIQVCGRLPPSHWNVCRSFKETLQGTKATLYVNPQAKSRYFKARTMPYAFKESIERGLERIQEEGTLEPVRFSNWAAPVVPILKPDGSVRICEDSQVTVYQALSRDQYSVPRIEDLFSMSAGGKRWDSSWAHQRVLLDGAAKPYLTINTRRGLFQYNRMPFGVSSAPSFSENYGKSVARDKTSHRIYLEEIYPDHVKKEEHLRKLEEVLKRLQQAGLITSEVERVQILQVSVQFLGH